MKKKIFVTQSYFNDVLENYKEFFNFEVYNHKYTISKKELLERAIGSFGLVTLLSDKIDKEIIRALAPDLKIIANVAAGVDNVDLECASQSEIKVTNTPDVLTDAVCELVIGMLIAVARKIVPYHHHVVQGKFEGWKPDAYLGSQIQGKKVGIIGLGKIGFGVAKRLVPFDVDILYYSRTRKAELEKKHFLHFSTIDEIVTECNYVILTCGLNESNFHMLHKERIQSMRPDSFIINVGRGALIDEKALIEALKMKTIRGAALDVYENEPEIPQSLRSLDNVVLLPHMGSATIETRRKMLKLALDNILNLSRGEELITPVI